MTEYRLRNERNDLVILQGSRLAHVNTDDGTKLRWIELSVFERDAGGYVYHTVGKSVVFHSHSSDSPCLSKGSPSKVDDLDFGTLESCTLCDPTTDPLSGTVLLEDELHTLIQCADYDSIVRAATLPNKGLTGPARQLLIQLSRRTQSETIRL